MTHSDNSSVCILRLTALGDCINAFGIANAIHEDYPEVKIKWIIDSRFSSLFISDGKPIVPMAPVEIKKQGLLKSVLSLRKELKGEQYDVLLNMQTSIKASLLSTAVRAKLKYGYDSERSREGQSLFVNRRIDKPQTPHVLSGFISFARTAGFEKIEPKWNYHLTPQEISRAKELIPQDKKILILAPASAKAEKNWTAEGYTEIGQYAVEKGFHVVIVGGKGGLETELCSRIADKLQSNCTNLCGKTSLRLLAAVISQASVVISPDSASMHLASSLNIPVIGLFAIHNPDRVGAWNFRQYEVSVYAQMAAAELGNKEAGWRYRVKNKEAMKAIDCQKVKEVFDRICNDYSLH